MDRPDRIARLRMRGLGLWDSTQPLPEAVVAHLTAMQSQEHPVARWSVAQRVAGDGTRASDVDGAFDRGDILRTHVLRPTWHYVARTDLGWLMALSGPRVAARLRRRLRDLELDVGTLTRANDVIAAAVAVGFQTRNDLALTLERARVSVEANHRDGSASPPGQRLAHILMHAELTSVVCSGPMRGKQHTYAAFDQRAAPAAPRTDDEAIAELAHRYFTTRGPATLKDFVWWSGLSTAEARHGIEMAKDDLASQSLEDRTYWFAEERAPRKGDRVDLVQCYDEVIISYTESRDVLKTPEVSFPVPGRVDGFTHVLLVDGRLAGHWRRVSGKEGLNFETQVAATLDRSEQRALAAELDRHRHFSEH